jgi:4-hydroxythreonine-4-phosphate dehydrogenase
MMNKTPQLVCITTGEPAGIGPEICLDLAYSPHNQKHILLLIGDSELLQQRAFLTKKSIVLQKVSREELSYLKPAAPGILRVLHLDCPQADCSGTPTAINARYVLDILDLAIDLCHKRLSQIMLTAPIHKGILNTVAPKFSGHTEYLAQAFAIPKVVMMLSTPKLKVALLTTHIPLSAVATAVTRENLNTSLSIIHNSYAQQFALAKPKIAVCGLNPHAGENGYLGDEEINIINPEIRKWQQAGYNVSGSFPADTIFNQADKYDIILAMYHDQGLPVIKYSDFAHGVNSTLGLPIIRTSPDHGTALDLAGTGSASSSSMSAALDLALINYNY